MIYAENHKGERILATPRAKGVCPACRDCMVAKCGHINVWHWSHKAINECDNWGEGESRWHLEWKTKGLSEKRVEYRIEKDGKYHIADIYIPSTNLVIELQKSLLSPFDIMERERFYEKMLWIFHVEKGYNFVFKEQDYGHSFKWKWARRSLRHCDRPVFLDLGVKEGLFHLHKLYESGHGWGKFISKDLFCKYYL